MEKDEKRKTEGKTAGKNKPGEFVSGESEKGRERSEENKGEEIRYIVRIANKDLDGKLPIARALMKMKGISHRYAKVVTEAFERESGIKEGTKLGELPEELDIKLEDIVLNPAKYNVPGWMLNRRKDFDDLSNKHVVMNELDFAKRRDLQRLSGVKSYRGLRNVWKLTVRGQKTKSTHRGKGAVVGVMKKDVKKGK